MLKTVVELLSIFAAFFYGCSGILVKKGLVSDSDSTPLSAALTTMLVNFVFMWVVYLFKSPPFVFGAVLFFALAGILAQCVGRTLSYTGVDRLGVSVNQPVVGAHPLFATLIAVIFLNEVLAPAIYGGVILVIIGIALISQKNKSLSEADVWEKGSLLFPLATAVCYGATASLRKTGLNVLNSPISGAAFAISAALSVYIPFLIVSGKIRTISLNRCSAGFFSCSGLSTSLAWICSFYALTMGKVAIVSSIVGTSPLFTLLLGRIFLKNEEKITYKIIIGALLLVLGVILISVFK